MEDLKWPVDKCENCGFDLREVTPRGHDKTGLSSDGLKKKMYTDYCPQCGQGYQVGYVEIPVPKEMTQEKPIIELPSPDKAPDEPALEPYVKPKGKAQSIAVSQVLKEEPKAIGGRELLSGEYLCQKCNKVHRESSKIGKSHIKHKTGEPTEKSAQEV